MTVGGSAAAHELRDSSFVHLGALAFKVALPRM